MSDPLEELHRKASGHYLRGDLGAAMDVWREVLALKPDDERAREGIRLCEKLEGGDKTEASPAQPESIAPSTVEVDRPPAFETTSVQPPGGGADGEPMRDMSPAGGGPLSSVPSVDPVAANELQRRTDSLLKEARTQAEQGDTEAALSTLERVLILDDENEAALSLRESLEPAEDEPGPDGPMLTPHSPEPADRDVAAQPAEPAFDRAPEAAQSRPLASPVAAPKPKPKPVPDLALLEPIKAIATGSAAVKPPTPRAKRFTFPSLPPWAQDRRVVLGVGGVLVVTVVCLVMGMFGGDDIPSPAPPEQNAAAAEATGAAQPEATVASDSSPDPERVTVASLLMEAEAASREENYAAAVIAYDRVLKQHPGHAEAVRNMKIVADRYREQQKRQQQWDDAVAAFENQNYVEALRLFYRMPSDEYAADIQRYKVNGWYNLGVASLQATDCERAIEHFKEARSMAPQDEGVALALELAVLCRGPAVRADIKRLRKRALND